MQLFYQVVKRSPVSFKVDKAVAEVEQAKKEFDKVDWLQQFVGKFCFVAMFFIAIWYTYYKLEMYIGVKAVVILLCFVFIALIVQLMFADVKEYKARKF